MATAGDVANRALKRILVQAADAPLEPDEYADFLDAMNAYMASLESDNIILGYTPVDNVADEVTVPEGAIRGMVAALAVEVAPDFGGFVSPELALQARRGEATLKRIGRRKVQTRFPTTLPQGSGYADDTLRTSAFFESQINALLSLTGNTRETALPTPGTSVRVNGFWSQKKSKGFRGDIRGRITNQTKNEQRATVKFKGHATGDGTYSLVLLKNGATEHSVTAVLTISPAQILFTHTLTLYPDEYLELAFQNDVNTNGATMVNGQLEVWA